MKYDIDIDGQGFYQITPNTKRAIEWMKLVQGFDGHVTHSDDTRMTQDIADGAFDDGMRVRVNGRHYLGNGKVAVCS